MKPGEKSALYLVLIAFFGLMAFAIFLELDYQQTASPTDRQQATENSRINTDRLANQPASAGRIPKGVTPDDLPNATGRGASILTLYCAQCHNLPIPAMLSSSEWPAVLKRMQAHLKASKSGMLQHVILPPENDWLILEKYLTENAQIPLDPLKYTDLSSAAGQAFIVVCSQCHAAPSPKSHTKNEWPRVVLRMKSNMLAAKILYQNKKHF